MSTVNVDLIEKSLDFLQEGLAPFIEREINKENISKEDILKKLKTPKRFSDRPINKWDLSALIDTMLTNWREVFSKTLTSADRGLVLESRDIRNKFHHKTPKYNEFSSNGDIYRALDTIWRLLNAISAPQSKEVERLKEGLLPSLEPQPSYKLPSPEHGERDKEQADKNGKIIGIDLGTTNSCVAVMKGDKCEPLDDRSGGYGAIIPSVVRFPKDKDKEIVVGMVADKNKWFFPQNTIYAVKRLIGRRFDDEEMQRYIEKVPYSVVRADNGDASVEVHDERKSPQEISAYVLCKMKEIAMQHFDEPIIGAVIAVPAYFNNSQRQATKDAGRIAGLDVKRIINEPTAAALNYAKGNWSKDSKIAVYDFGGGTFDISIIKMVEIDGKRRVEVKSINGDTLLGGMDFDKCIFEHICNKIKKENGVNLLNNKDPNASKVTSSEIMKVAEEAKKDLSSDEQALITIRPLDSEVGAHQIELTRSELESLVKSLIDRTIEPCQIAMKDAGVSASDIDEVILVGGQTRMPKVQEVVESIFGKKPKWGVDPEKSVALGAAILGGMLTEGDGKAIPEDMPPQDVIPHSLGVKLKSGKMKKLISKGTTIPAKKSHVFSTPGDNLTVVSVHVLQGERDRADDNIQLGHFDLEGIPPTPLGVPKIEVTFDIDANGILNVSAKDKTTDKKQSIKITDRSILDLDEIKRMQEKMPMIGDLKASQVKESREFRLPDATIDRSGRDVWTLLHEAAWNGDFEAVKGLVNAGADPNEANNHGHTPLHLAAFEGHFFVVQELVDAGSKPNAKDEKGETPLHKAAWNGDFEAAKELVNAGADPNAANNHGDTPLHLAAFKGHFFVVQKLIDAGSEPNAKEEKGATPLHNAAYRGHFGSIKALVNVGANVEATLPDGTKPSDIAAEQGHRETFAAAVAAAKRAD